MKQATSYDNDLERTEQRTGGLVLFLGEEEQPQRIAKVPAKGCAMTAPAHLTHPPDSSV